MSEEDKRKDEIKQSRSEEEEKGPKQGQGEGEGRNYILMFNFREEKLSCLSLQQRTAWPPLIRQFHFKKHATPRQRTSSR